MKRSFTIVALLLLAGSKLMAQKEVLFKMKVSPDKHYTMLMKMDMNMEMNVSGDTAVINKIKKSGQSFPILMTMQTGTNGEINTGRLNAEKKIPFTMLMTTLPTKMSINGKDNPIPMPVTNTTMYGTYTPEGKMSIDSIAGKKADDALKESMSKMMDGIQSKVKFPDKPMKVGDSFTQDMPMDLPIAGMSAKMISKTTYKLTSIENNLAYFDLVYEITMDMSGGKINMDMTGGGDGKFVYSIAANYPVDLKTNWNIIYSMSMPQMESAKMAGKMNMQMNYKTTIADK